MAKSVTVLDKPSAVSFAKVGNAYEQNGAHPGNHLSDASEGIPNGEPERSLSMPIAIVGMSCRFPGNATSPERLWNLCADGETAWTKIPEDRFKQGAWYHPESTHLGTTYASGGHFLAEDIARFDASFFNFSSEQAATMDPQVRLQLESVFEALESAGIPLDKIAGSNTSVYAGACFRDYHDSLMRDPTTLPRFFLTGNGAAMISNRISHFFDLRGESMSIDTGCSTTLTLLHMACQSLRTGNSKISIVGGSNILLNPDIYITLSNLGLLSPDGKSYAFDSRASGYGRGEGIATIILKPLEDALRDGDPVRAIIRHTGANQDGKTATITSPNQSAQEELIRSCYRAAGLDPVETGYVEAHGTGTQTGDSIEAGALGAVFGSNRAPGEPIYIGSVKTNIGHTEATSGLAGVIKAVMALEKEAIPPNANFENPNENIPFDKLGLKESKELVPRKVAEWPSRSKRRVSVNNFGYGGSNAHAIIEDPRYLLPKKTGHLNGFAVKSRKVRIFTLSAKDELSARASARNLKSYLLGVPGNREKEKLLDNLAYTLSERRTKFTWASALSVGSFDDLISALDHIKPRRSSKVPRLGFVFTGQGAQWHAMGRELIDQYPVFKATLIEVERQLKSFGASWSLLEELQRDSYKSKINEVHISLPSCVAVQLALVELLRSWNVHPAGVTSHSSGEVAAAYAAGAIDLRSAVAIAYLRGALTESSRKDYVTPGAMAAVGLSRIETVRRLARLNTGKAVVACENSPTSVTISGDSTAIEEMEAELSKEGIFIRRLKVDAAYHSHHMQPIADDYSRLLSTILVPTKEGLLNEVVFSSPTTGDHIYSANTLNRSEHWVKNMLQPVEFLSSLENLCALNSNGTTTAAVDVLIEVGPHGALAGPIRQCMNIPTLKKLGIIYGTCLNRGHNAVESMQALACMLVENGYPVNLAAVNFPSGNADKEVVHDLPNYPWNHQVRHWMEPRLNKVLRDRANAPHDLLGIRAPDSNSLTSIWRHVIRATDIPWVRDHRIQSDIVYPGAGYICMAIEGARQMAQSTPMSVAEYNFRDIEILKALVLTDDAKGVEVQLMLQLCKDRILQAQGWHEFTVSSFDDYHKSAVHCEGLIQVVLREQGPVQTELTHIGLEENKTKAPVHLRHTAPNELYDTLRAVGVYHGPVFQNITAISSGQATSVCTFSIADTAATLPGEFEEDHVIHPTTLDSVFQAAYSALPGPLASHNTAYIPRKIKSMRVSQCMGRKAAYSFDATTEILRHTPQAFVTSIQVHSHGKENKSPVIEVDGLLCQSLGISPVTPKPADNRLCFTTVWKRDFDLMWRPNTRFSRPTEEVDDQVDLKLGLAQAVSILIHDALQASAGTKPLIAPDHVGFYEWMVQQDCKAQRNLIEPASAKWLRKSHAEKQALLDRVESDSAIGRLVCHVGRQLPNILHGRTSAPELLKEDTAFQDYTASVLESQDYLNHLSSMLSLFAHKNPRAKILEIGAGKGALTSLILRSMESNDAPTRFRFAHYTYTDPSLNLCESAKNAFITCGQSISFKQFDLDREPIEQGLDKSGFDLVIGCNSMFLTADPSRSLQHIHKLLKPHGKLLIMEPDPQKPVNRVICGRLPLSSSSWTSRLKEAGFSDVSIDAIDYAHSSSILVAATRLRVRSEHPNGVQIVYGQQPPPTQWLEQLVTSICSFTGEISVESLEDANPKDRTCIFFDVDEHSILHESTDACLKLLKNLLLRSKGVLWISRGATRGSSNPFGSMHVGLLRTLRCENSTTRYISLDLDCTAPAWDSCSVQHVADVFKASFDYADLENRLELEYAVSDGYLEISRVLEDSRENQAVALESSQQPQVMTFFGNRELRLGIRAPGLLDSLVFEDNPTMTEPLKSDWVEIQPKAFGLNFRDVMVAMGQLNESRMGFECSGVISRVGRDAHLHGLNVGDHVYAFFVGYFASTVRVRYTSVAPIPADMDFETAASIPLVFTTAYHALYNLAQIRKGETVLIHSGSGGVGQAAIMLAQLAGCQIFVTVGSEQKQEFITRTYGIPPERIFSSRSMTFAQNIKRATHGKGVDVVLNSLAGPLLQESWQCMAPFGRFIEIGKRDLELNNNLNMGPFVRSLSFSSFDLITLCEERGEKIAEIFKGVNKLFDEGSVRAVSPRTVFSISEVEKAFRIMQGGKHMGKIILKPNPEDVVMAQPDSNRLQLSSLETYAIVGGLGGLGRSIARRLAERGARYLLVLSRNACSQDSRPHPFVQQLASCGVTVVLKNCDVSDEKQLAKVVEECRASMPPIKGVIQCAMVLRDTIFQQMSHEDYSASIKPKVQGSWNLHRLLLKSDHRFFVMLSSISGFGGNSGQANYAAGCAFQDALARHRAAKGLPAVSINLGMVKSVGVVSENEKIAARLTKLGFRPLEEEEVLRLIESAIYEPLRDVQASQVITGIPPSFVRSGTAAFWNTDRRFSSLESTADVAMLEEEDSKRHKTGRWDLARELESAPSMEKAVNLISDSLTKKLSEMFVVPESEINLDASLSTLGVDSLIAVELRNWLSVNAQADCSVFDVMQSSSPLALAARIAAKSTALPESMLKAMNGSC